MDASGAELEADRYLDDPRWRVAERVSETALRRFAADILAVAVHGPLAHGDEDGGGDGEVGLLVATYRPGSGPSPATRRVDGVLVELTVAGADDYLGQARTIGPLWPLTADRYVTTRALHDPTGWLRTLRDEHLARLARARPAEFSASARQAWYRGSAAHSRALRLAEWYETDQALLMLGEARLAAATVHGLLSRTYFRDPGDAVRRTGLAGADMTEVGAVLTRQAEELAARGRPVDGSVDDLLTA
ncbi:nucleotidyltransferase domain-containing protein [Micromonospora sp. DR5-3]|uniref:nucleotidyltransferase domain-containing protein n=1 Tax=unclassified Micromonospora TaxID=2617518 RepID=UPI0011D452F2|nr:MULTISPECIES: nucleotidyltransferase domain-containing protein [unclassified Micromonospora]MCW3813455.1 nucleotidyltransferase domain-containing protein [Micromonospora sp. DR5-3]TYC24876.1 nucleotidyltransferase domain-containing protein [Micromonospora sp. MP36]